MRNLFCLGVHTSLLLVIFFMSVMLGRSLRMSPHVPLNRERQVVTGNKDNARTYVEEGGGGGGGAKEEGGLVGLYPTGSTLPDCSRACGPCFPCKRVMVSFKCSISESCPVVYRCTCKGKYYHVPGV